MISRQVIKTIEAIRDPNIESIPTRKVVKMLEALDFEYAVGEHQNWRHACGARFTLVHNPGKDIWGYKMKDIRNLLKLLEEKEVLPTMGIPLNSDRVVDTRALAEHKLQQQQAGNKGEMPMTTLKMVHDQLVEIKEQLKMLESVQELLLEVAAKMEGGAIARELPSTNNKKRTEAEIRELKRQGTLKAHAARKQNKIDKIRKILAKKPQLRDRLFELSQEAKVGVVTLAKYQAEGLF